MEDKYCLYVHLNLANDKCYIGITKNIKKRWAKKEKSYCKQTLIYRAFTKYGWDGFIRVVLFGNMTKERACEKEKEWIQFFKYHKMSYNMTDGGEGVSGIECKNKRKVYVYSKAGELKGKYKSIKACELDLFGTENRYSGSIVNVCAGRKKSYKGYVFSYTPLNIEYFSFFKPKKIAKYTLNDELICVYEGWQNIKKEFKDVRNIASCLGKHKKTANGFKWKYYEVD